MDKQIIAFIQDSLFQGKKVVLACVIDVSGSSPARQRAMMAYNQDANTLGTVGGGAIEAHVKKIAEECIQKNEDRYMEIPLNDREVGMMCGGKVTFFFKCFMPSKKLLIIGGGHIGHALYNLASQLDYEITVFDERIEYAHKERYRKATIINTWEELSLVPTDGYTAIVIVGNSHIVDQKALQILIGKSNNYIGMIGSKAKIANIFQNMRQGGISDDLLSKVYAPIGLDIGRTVPSEIALGILAQIVQIKNNT